MLEGTGRDRFIYFIYLSGCLASRHISSQKDWHCRLYYSLLHIALVYNMCTCAGTSWLMHMCTLTSPLPSPDMRTRAMASLGTLARSAHTTEQYVELVTRSSVALASGRGCSWTRGSALLTSSLASTPNARATTRTSLGTTGRTHCSSRSM
jgi:hypothetical protein